MTSLLETEIVNSCASPTTTPVSLSTVNDPVVVSLASALRKLPPAMTVAEVFDVPETSMFAACVLVPSNTALKVEFSVKPALISANPDCDTLGVKVSLESIATLVLPTYIEDTTLSPPALASVSIFQPDSVCPAVYTGPTSTNADPVYTYSWSSVELCQRSPADAEVGADAWDFAAPVGLNADPS